jgi:hypothetical protein
MTSRTGCHNRYNSRHGLSAAAFEAINTYSFVLELHRRRNSSFLTHCWRKTDSNPQSLAEGKCWKGRTSRRGGSFFTGGLRVRIRFPPPVSLSRQCLPCLPAQRPGFRPECEPGRDQRKGRADHEPARLGCSSLIGIDAVPLGKSKRSTKGAQDLGLDTLCRGSLFS